MYRLGGGHMGDPLFLQRRASVIEKYGRLRHTHPALPADLRDFQVYSWLVRFPNSLAFGSELGLHYPYRRGIFLSTLPARPIWTAHGQGGAYWIAPHLRKPHAQARLFFTHWSCRLHSIFILRQNATFAGGRYCSWISHFPAFRFPPPECNFCVC